MKHKMTANILVSTLSESPTEVIMHIYHTKIKGKNAKCSKNLSAVQWGLSSPQKTWGVSISTRQELFL